MEICQCDLCGIVFELIELVNSRCPNCGSRNWFIRDSNNIIEIEEELEGVLKK